jgi:hypothetical protein
MARTEATLPGGARLADYLAVGYLALNCSLGEVKEALVKCGVHTRLRRDMPREVLVYFVMAMCLYPRVAYEEVFRLVIEGLRRIYGDQVRDAQVSKAAISQGRARLGWQVMRELFARQAAQRPRTAGGDYAGYRVMSVDGSTLDVPDEKVNAEAFGYARGGRGEAAYPQIRFVALAECATHALCEVQMGGVCNDSEQALTRQLLPAFSDDMLVLADRLFYGYDMWRDAVATGAKLLWRVKSNLRLPCEAPLADGSYLSTVYASDTDRRHQRNGMRVRVIEYRLEGVPDAEPQYRLITNLLDAAVAPAIELAALYHRRWKIEEMFDEIKTHLCDGKKVLRSKTPDLVRQEFYALMLTHAAIRRLMYEAAQDSGQRPEDLSFVHAVRVLNRRLPEAAAIPP